ncbi:hypothetical protein [Bradyrhizobium zhanjiangense]|uniref:hypothetical protein n=1 Tax=Bradyrhizobium zhanjiangense TaxID=1325107 RepID=UPI0013E89B34|nr:hypothetical protein [Bradyrhizobium zhanjiangense]
MAERKIREVGSSLALLGAVCCSFDSVPSWRRRSRLISEAYDRTVVEESKMRVLSVAFFALASLAQAHAQEKIKTPESACSYTTSRGDTYTVPGGKALCWRVPAPSYKEYTLLHCDGPMFRELVRVKRSDPRCDKYEERQ